MGKSAIPYVDDGWGVMTGCTKLSDGCRECWAQAMLKRFGKPLTPTLHPEKLDEPLKARRPRTVFVAPMGDLWHEAVADEFIDQVFAVMSLAPEHTFLLLTKHGASGQKPRLRDYFQEPTRQARVGRAIMLLPWQPRQDKIVAERVMWGRSDDGLLVPALIDPWPLPNVWLGVSVEDQEQADKRIPVLLATPAAHHWLSAEPLLGPLDLTPYVNLGARPFAFGKAYAGKRIDYLVTAPESGPGRRPCELDWVRSIVSQCDAAQVPCMVKHLFVDGKKVSLPLLDGRRWAALPGAGP